MSREFCTVTGCDNAPAKTHGTWCDMHRNEYARCWRRGEKPSWANHDRGDSNNPKCKHCNEGHVYGFQPGRPSICLRCRSVSRIAHSFKMTIEEIVKLRSKTNNCEICDRELIDYSPGRNRKNSKCIDHNHKTGEIRGLLCNDCNINLGRFEDIGVDKIINYLNKYGKQ